MTVCPCCKQPAAFPSLDDVIAACRLNGFEAKIFSAVWAGQGMSVQTEKIFDAMYQDDINGGPSPNSMYAAFNKSLRRLNSQLSGAGIAIVSNRYRKGYRLSLGGNRGQGS
ncbi:hypothetical protein [Bradyrhizobium sp. AZCC 1708]|uniref:hypothetical protein n=1 Tax=Bradyrhizobium sp. AZCC 1708 TaxID=3117015 RepID=UPI002FF391C8